MTPVDSLKAEGPPMDAILEAAKTLRQRLNQLPESRERSLARTKLEECLLWATVAPRIAL